MDHFTPEELLFEIPVYRLSYDDYHAALGKRIKEAGDRYVENLRPTDPWSDDEERARRWAEEHERRRYGRPYWYNEMIGVIRLYQDGGSIKGQFWGQPHQIFRWNFRHYDYEHHGRVLEYHLGPHRQSSEEIYQDLHEYLSDLNERGRQFERRRIDLCGFDRLGPHVDWLSVLGLERP